MRQPKDQPDRLMDTLGILFDAMPDLVGVMDAAGRLLSVNRAWTRKLGHTTLDVSGRPLGDLVHEDDRSTLIQATGSRFGDQCARQLRMRARDGGYRWVESLVVGLPDRSEIVTIARDIDDRKQLEFRLDEAEATFQELVENADDAICTADLDGQLTSVNRAAERMCGYSREEVLGKPFATFVAPEYHDTLKRMTRSKLDGRESAVFEVDILTRSGDRIPVELNTRLRIRDGQPVGIQGIARDIRGRRRLAEDLRQRNIDLEAANRTIRALLNQDPLTKLANRRHLESEMERAMSFARRSDQALAIVICDVDGFKQVNDRFGHAVGDAVLAAFGDVLGNSCRREDTAARYGGEEFVLLLPNTGLDAAADFAERIRAETLTLRVPSGPNITASFGVAVMRGDDSRASLVARADAALYAAKQAGRNRVATG